MKKTTFFPFIFFLFKNFFKTNSSFFTFKKKSVSVIMILMLALASNDLFAQLAVPFTPRLPGGNVKVKGDVVLIGNTVITGQGLALPYNGNTNNNNLVGAYINVASGGDPTIFSSSTADLALNNSCKNILFAGLYWASIYPLEVATNSNQQFVGTPRLNDWNQVKFRLPTGGFNDLVADDVIFDGYDPVNINNSFKDSPIICFKDVTTLLQGLADADGTYTVANLRATRGSRTGGCAAGWTLVVIYESPTMPSKFISIFDGYAGVQGNTNLDIPVSGFQTLPAPSPVFAKIGVSALEGDLGITNDRFQFKASTSGSYTNISDARNPANNFFNSTISNEGAYLTNRNPNSRNNLGYDIDNVIIPNPGNGVLPNNATAGDLRLTTTGDGYGAFVTTFAVDIIEPKILLTKIVQDALGNDIGGANVTLGDQLNYVIGFQNIGNDDATELTIRDILPINVIFNYPADLDILPPGVTVQSYNPITREIVFKIADSVVEINDPLLNIRFKVQVVPSCNMLSDACSNSIDNQAYATYEGVFNPNFTISDDPSINSNAGCVFTPKATNFLVGVDDCIFTSNEVLCGNSVVLTAANGYSSYSWSTDPSGSPVIGNTQSITVNNTGTYYVHNTAVAPCLSIDQVITVVPFGNTVSNPVIPFADEVVTCPNDGKALPNIFLCGANSSRDITTGINDTSSIIWEKLNEGSCAAVANSDCANESSSCSWSQVGTGPNYTANAAGQYRITLNYTGGCFNRYYFNVYQNLLNPTATTKDIICNTPGEITVGGVGSGYEYSLDGSTYQSSNVFSIATQNFYTVYIRQTGVTSNPCIFTVPDIQIRARNFTVSTVITPPLCNGGKGSVKIAANDVRPQYYYSIYSGATLVNSVGPIVQSDYTFPDLNPGTYTINVSTDDGCTYTNDIQIINPPLLTATAAITKPLTCTDGEITVYPVGGTAPYFYFVSGTPGFETVPEIVVTTSGVYDITVVDSNNCSTTTSITVNATPPPVYNITKTDVLCANSGDTGSINVNVTNANGNSLRYSIDNGVTFANSSTFTVLSAGTYDVIVEYTIGTDVCLSVPQTITINAATAITGTATLTTPYTCTTNGTITVSGVSGGNAPYTYSINGVTFQGGTTFTGLTNGTYTVTIRDANACTITTSPIVIAPLNPPTDLLFSSSPLSCPTNTSTITLTTTGGVGTLQYRIIAPSGAVTAYQPSTSFAGLAPATYTFEVRDANDCTYSESYTIVPLPALTVVGQKINDITCFGASDGAARFTVSGSTNFTYTINGGASIAGTSPINLSGLAAASYTIVITDSTTNCQATASVTIDSPASALSLTTTVTPITCNANGSVVINAVGGWGGNSYMLTQPDTTVIPAQGSNTFSNLSQSGIYTVTVTDSKGCIETITFSLSIPVAPTASIAVTSDYCYDSINGATLEVTTSGGIAPYQYNINGGSFGSSNIFANLTPGSYTIIVRDSYGCTVTLPVQTIAPQVTVNTVLTKELDCTASPDAIITGTITGGYAPFTYEVSINGSAYSSLGTTGSPFVYTTANSGTYQFRITDNNSCQAVSNVITIDPITNPTATTTAINPTCNGNANGSVQIMPSGGVGPYVYSFNGSGFTSTSLYNGLNAGTYSYQVRDSKSCIFSGSVTLTEPTALVATASATAFSCSVTNTKQSAVITIAVPTTGTAPYQYSFNNGTTFSASNTLTVNDNGSNQSFSYVVRDANGCLTAAQNITLNALNPPTDLTFSSSAVTCTATTSTVSLTPTNGVGTLQYETIAPSPIIVAQQTSNTFAGLTPGTYVFRVTDANGCYYTESYTVAPVTPITITGLKLSDVLCNGDNTGAIRFTVSGYAGTYTSTLTSGSGTLNQSGNTIDLTGLVAGTYTVSITDDITGCTDDETITITQPASALSFTATSTNVYCTEDNAQITVTASGGTVSYTYAAVVTGSPAPAVYGASSVITVDTNSAADLTWDVYVRDANGCVAMNPITITADVLPTVTTPPLASNQCSVNSGFTFTATGTGLAPLSYSINGGASYQASPTFTVNTPGSYTLTIKDKNGCTATSATPTVVYTPLTTSALLTKDITCAPAPTDASIDITVSGGNAPYSYEVSYNGGGYTPIAGSPYSASLAGTYQFRITDANSCTKVTNVVTVTTPINPVIVSLAQTQSILCNSEETAAISVNFNNTVGVAPFVINVNNDTTGTNYGTQTSGLAAGDYTITLTDANGCFDTDTITISEPTPIVINYTVTPITCGVGGISLGEIVINSVTGGTPNYTYHVTGANGYDQELLNQTGATQVFEVVDFGIYEIIITDANGCSLIEQNILVASPPDDLDIVINSTVNCATGGEADVSIGTATTITGVGPFYFAIYTGPGMVWDGIPGGSAIWQLGSGSPVSTTFTNLISGVTYTFIVYDDDTKCYYFETATTPIATSSTLTTTGLTAENITCRGSADGNVSFDINSIYGIGIDVDYEIFDSQSLATTGISGSGTVPANGTLSVTNLGPLDFGNYIVVIAETTGPNAGCGVATMPFNITESAIDLSISASVTKNENCNELGVISAIARDGTAPYEFQLLLATDPAPIATSAGWGSANTFSTTSDNYIVYVKDAYGCIRSAAITLDRDPEPTIAPIASQCFDGTPITITLVEGTGTAIAPLTYSIGGAYQSSDTFTISTAGSYTVSIRDGNGCIATTTYIVQPPLLLDADMTQDLTCAVDASINLTPSGGVGPYTYEVDFNGGGYIAASTPYTATIDGTYQFRVTDSQNCTAESNVIIVTPKTTPTFTFTQTNATCNGDSDGSIVVTAADGIAPYKYSIDNGVNFLASNVFNGLSAGSYDVVVRDSKNCDSAPTTVTITEPVILAGTGALTQGLTCGAGNATQAAIVTITATAGTGTAPYTYSFDGGVNYTSTNTYSTFTSGTVSAYIKDANGCITGPIDVIVPALDPPTDLDFSATAVTCLATTSDVTLTATNGVGPLSYEIITPITVGPQASNVFTGLSPDTYTFIVTDANFCTYQESYTVVPVTNITVSGTLVSDVSCNAGSNGAVDFTVSNFAGTYSYTINGVPVGAGVSALTIPLTGLAIGNQTIVVTDDITGCTATETILVSEPTALTLVETTNINANCNFGAQVSVTAGGGTPNYTYAFVQDGASPAGLYTSSDNAVLDPAVNVNWDVWVMDANGCTTQIDVVIATDLLPTVTVPALASNQCNLSGDPYEFTITSSTGILPLTYSIGTGFQPSGTFTGLTPGTYFVTVKDGNGCTAVSSTSVTIYPPLDVTPAITTLPSCSDDDGVITVTGSGGTGVYTYAISPSPASITPTATGFSGVPSGTYTVTITDTNTSCSKDVSVTLSAATPVTFTTSVNDVSCNGGNDGIITVNLPASNDNPIYTYEITAGPILFGPQNSNIFTGLVAGNYTVEVNSGRGCSNTQIVPVGEPTLLTVSGVATDFGCAPNNSVNTSTLTITEGGGTAPYTYSIDGVNYLSSNVFDIIDTGLTQNINIFVKDSNGCIETDTVTILPLPTMTAASVAIVTPIDCNNTGSVAINVTGGSGNFSYQMLPSGAPQASNTFSITVPGDYYFQVNDLDTGCTITTPAFIVAPFDLIDVSATPTTAVTCFSDTDGALEITVTGYSGPYNYEVFDNLNNSVAVGTGDTTVTNPLQIIGFSGGNYTVTVTETASPFCVAVSNVITIASPADPLALVATETSNVTCTNDRGTITAVANGGWGSYEYELTGAANVAYSSNGTFTNLSAGNYTVNVRDAGGCIVSQGVTLAIPIPINANVTPSTTLLACFGDTNASITVSGVTGGQGSNYSYTLNRILPNTNSSGPQSSTVFSGLGAGTYNVVVNDGYNCVFTSNNIVINEPTQVESLLVKSTSQTCLTGTTLALSAIGGTGMYEYSDTASFTTVLGSFASSTSFGVAPGTYVYYVRDANGCYANVSNQIKIDPLPPLVVNIDATNAFINCVGDDTGVIVAKAQGGLGNYTYILQDASGTDIAPAPTQNSPGVFTQLPAGTYQVRVTSGIDCEAVSAQVQITEPALALQVSFNVIDVSCNGGNDGILEITATGGTGTIQYAITPQLNKFFDTPIFDDLVAGSYQVIVQDQLGCYVLIDFVVGEPAPVLLSIIPSSIIPEGCVDELDGEFSVDISGGNLPYSVSLDDINGPYSTGTLTQTQFDFAGLAGGNHIVYVIDNNGCESEWNITFPESVRIIAEADISYCTNTLDASTNMVTVNVDDTLVNLNDLDYSLDGGAFQLANTFMDLPPGNHFITVRHPNTCEVIVDFVIEQFDPLQIAIADGGINEIVATASGGSGIYDYEVQFENSSNSETYGSTSTFPIYKSGNYTVTVTDSNGCIAVATGYFEYIDVCITNYFTPNNDGTQDEWGPGCTNIYQNLTVAIFDRYGRQVSTLRVGQKWDGTYNGKELPSGDYWYVLKLNDKRDDREFVGNFTLYR